MKTPHYIDIELAYTKRTKVFKITQINMCILCHLMKQWAGKIQEGNKLP